MMNGNEINNGAKGQLNKGMIKGRLPIIAWRNLRLDFRDIVNVTASLSEMSIITKI
jgi:hypothetical protein